MSNILAVQDINNDIGVGTNSINLTTNNNFTFIDNNNNKYLELHTTNNTIGVGTIKQGNWNGETISTLYGGTGFSQLGLVDQFIAIKSENEYEFTNSNLVFQKVNSIANNAQNNITIGNSNTPITLNILNNLTINSSPENDQYLGYSNNSVKFISANINELTNDLWTIMNIFYPKYKLLLANLIINKDQESTNLIQFIPTKYNYTINLENTTQTITIVPEVFNDSIITISNNINSDLNSYQTTQNPYILPNGISCNFNIKVTNNTDSQIYTLEFIQTSITVDIEIYEIYEDNTYQEQLIADHYYDNLELYVKIIFSQVVVNFGENDIIESLCTIKDFNNVDNSLYTCTININNQIEPSIIKLKIPKISNIDNNGNSNEANSFKFNFDNIRPNITIEAYKNISGGSYVNQINNNSNIGSISAILRNSDISDNKIYIKYIINQNTNDFIKNHINYTLDDNNLYSDSNNKPIITGSYPGNVFTTEFVLSGHGKYSINVNSRRFTGAIGNNYFNNPSNIFTFNLISMLDNLSNNITIKSTSDVYWAQYNVTLNSMQNNLTNANGISLLGVKTTYLDLHDPPRANIEPAIPAIGNVSDETIWTLTKNSYTGTGDPSYRLQCTESPYYLIDIHLEDPQETITTVSTKIYIYDGPNQTKKYINERFSDRNHPDYPNFAFIEKQDVATQPNPTVWEFKIVPNNITIKSTSDVYWAQYNTSLSAFPNNLTNAYGISLLGVTSIYHGYVNIEPPHPANGNIPDETIWTLTKNSYTGTGDPSYRLQCTESPYYLIDIYLEDPQETTTTVSTKIYIYDNQIKKYINERFDPHHPDYPAFAFIEKQDVATQQNPTVWEFRIV